MNPNSTIKSTVNLRAVAVAMTLYAKGSVCLFRTPRSTVCSRNSVAVLMPHVPCSVFEAKSTFSIREISRRSSEILI